MDWPPFIGIVILAVFVGEVQSRSRSAKLANQRIARLEKSLNSIQAHVGIPRDPGNEEVISLLWEGKKINAIKLYREQTGAGLREAKDAVDAIERDLMQPL